MKKVPSTEGSLTVMPLHQLINKVMIGLLPLALSHKSFVINDVNPDVNVLVDENMLALVVGAMLNQTLSATENECIRVEASCGKDATSISVKTISQFLYGNSVSGFREMELAAKKIGGSISISPSTSGVVVTCSFNKTLKAA